MTRQRGHNATVFSCVILCYWVRTAVYLDVKNDIDITFMTLDLIHLGLKF